MGIDKLTIHLFGHTINLGNNSASESSKHTDVVAPSEQRLIAVHNLHNVVPQNWNTLKTQASSDCSETRAESSSSPVGASAAGSKIYLAHSQPQSRDLLGKGAAQQLVSDYNYDVIKINILPSESHGVALGPSLQEILKTHCAAQSFCNGDVKQPNMLPENTQAGKAVAMSGHFADDWMEKQSCGPLTAAKGTVPEVYRGIEAECVEPSDGQHIASKKGPMMSLMNKENGLSDFQSIPDHAAPICRIDASLEQRRPNDGRSPHDATDASTAEDRDRGSREQRKILTAQTCAKIFQSATPKEKTERCDVCGFHFPDVNILVLHQQLVHEQESENAPGKVLKNYSCHLCSKVFKMRGSLMVHMRVVHVGHNLGESIASTLAFSRPSLSLVWSAEPIAHVYNRMYAGSLPKDGDQIELAHGDVGYNCPTCGKRFKKVRTTRNFPRFTFDTRTLYRNAKQKETRFFTSPSNFCQALAR